jgi:hypothetical protein
MHPILRSLPRKNGWHFPFAFFDRSAKLAIGHKQLASKEKSPPPQKQGGFVSSSQGDKTAIDLFVQGLSIWTHDVRRRFCNIQRARPTLV